MGIKGIYGEIGPGDRASLVKLSIEKFERTGVPLRVAIDISIWNFQIQSGQGGTNPALRTLYYRLLRLLSVSIQPLFVFDGPHKPPVKRNKRTGHGGASIPDLMSKELLKLFGFAYHIAPGEAEAECALLQREGIVDAVLSEDVDTLMFGSGLTFRNWSAETTKAKIPTHVNVYDSAKTKAGRSGLDREGMILVALMSGGDYKTEGIPGCGVKVACEAARAGFGKSLCQIPRADTAGYEAWRENLAHELKTNESKFFKVKRKAQQIPEDFPDRKVLGYYTHPVVSSAAKVQRLKEQIIWDGELDIQKLRAFVADAFEWKGKEGVKKFIRGLAPALLVLRLRQRGNRRDSGLDDLVLTKINEMALVRSICGKREHISTDGMPEMRVIYHPLEIVGIDPDEEQDDDIHDYGRDGLAPLLEDDQIEAYASDDAGAVDDSPRKRGPSLYDPSQADKLWVAETLVRIGAPLTSEDYDESLRDPRKFLKQKAAAKKAAAKTTKSAGGMRPGALDPFVQISKTSTRNTTKVPGEVTEDSEEITTCFPGSCPGYRRPPVPLSDEDEPSPATDLPRHRSQESDKPSPRKKRSPLHSTTKSVMHSSPARRTPLTPQPVNRQINFALHSSITKSSASSSSYNTAPSQIIDLSSPSPSASPYPLNACTPIPKSNEVVDLPSPEQQYIHDMGLHKSIIHNLNSSKRIPASVRELDVDERVYLEDMGLGVEPVGEVVEVQEMEVDVEIESEVEIVMNVEQELDQGRQKKKDGIVAWVLERGGQGGAGGGEE
ncbi:flap structure-specific endonuclease protein [Rutstroemia sp. NJR-2017a BBW]|nr:flap structure-specific endonuclease protein [Rutstroemia sp. NJR-2017a BBW]